MFTVMAELYYDLEMPCWTACVGRLVLGAVIGAAAGGRMEAQAAAPECDGDTRCAALRTMFERHRSPLVAAVPVFLQAAAANGLDWRLLPAISIVETTGGRFGRRNNVFGWNSGRARFASAEACIQFVAERLAKSPRYAGLSALGILRQYNPARKSYTPKVTKVMLEIAGDPVE
jgi:hypothetical protein